MVVQLGPKSNAADDIIARTLLKNYAQEAKLYDSSIKIRQKAVEKARRE